MRPERLRLLLGIMILAVGIRFVFVLVVSPSDTYAVQPLVGSQVQ